MTRIARIAALICATMGIIFLTSLPQDRLYADPNEVGTKTIVIPVEGMTCSSCVARVKRTLKAIDGVMEVKVDLERRSVRVRYREERVSAGSLVEAINTSGYRAGTPVSEGIK